LAMSLTSIWGHFLMSLCDITVNAVWSVTRSGEQMM